MKFSTFIIALCLWCGIFSVASADTIKLPYAKGQSFVVVQGYNSPPTHINKDHYALDFSQNGCDAYAKPAVAAAGGIVVLAEQTGYNGGYGSEVLINQGGNVLARYAHLISGSLAVHDDETIFQGTTLGAIGDTGLVAGDACPEHPGTHIHFATYYQSSDGTYVAVKPEPISGYVGITAGKWYLSDNGPDTSVQGKAQAIPATPPVGSGNTSPVVSDSPVPLAAANSENPSSGAQASQANGQTLGASSGTPTLEDFPVSVAAPAAPYGGVSSGGGSNPLPQTTLQDQSSSPAPTSTLSTFAVSTPEAPETAAPSSSLSVVSSSSASLGPIIPPGGSSAVADFNSSTLADDFSWQPPANASGTVFYSIFDFGAAASSVAETSLPAPIWTGTSTNFSYPVPADGTVHIFGVVATDVAGDMSFATTSVSTPSWFSVFQGDDSSVSYPSWYEDNWYDLGTGFYGTIRSLMLEGHIDNPDYFASHLALDEFLDPGYAALNRSFDLSDGARFTATSSFVTVGGLDVHLQPNKYYRLTTYQDYQNRSVILAGTTATGTAMHDSYIIGEGRVETTSSFYPYLAWTFVPNYPPLAPPNQISTATVAFDAIDLDVTVSWLAATDPDTTSSLLTYQVAVSTSTTTDPGAWQSVGKNLSYTIPVVFGDTYAIGIRAVDDLGNISEPLVVPWSFPANYVVLPSQLMYGDVVNSTQEKFHLSGDVTLSALGLWIAGQYGRYCCSQSYISLSADSGGVPGAVIASSVPVTVGGGFAGGEQWYSFSGGITLPAGDYWFTIAGGPSPTTNGTTFYGSNGLLYFRLQMSNGP